MIKLHLPLPIGTSALITSPDRPGEFVAVHRKENPHLLCFPGGKLDPHENIVQAVTREVFEETGLIIELDQMLPIYAGICEGQQEYWVTVFLTTIKGEIEFNSQEPEMKPIWTTKSHFMQNTAFPLFNQQVFNAIEKWF